MIQTQNQASTSGFDATLAEEVIPSIPARRSINSFLTSRAGSIMLQDAMLEVGHDRCRALLAQSALQNAGALAAMATRLCSIAPHGSEHYHAIVDAYARNAAEQIERW